MQIRSLYYKSYHEILGCSRKNLHLKPMDQLESLELLWCNRINNADFTSYLKLQSGAIAVKYES